MTLGSCVALVGLLGGFVAPRLLLRARLDEHPRAGVVLWLSALAGVAAMWIAATGLLTFAAVRALTHPGTRADCVSALPCGVLHVTPGFALATTIAGATVAAIGLIWHAQRAARVWWRARRAAHRHSVAAGVLGRPAPDLGTGVVVIDAAERAVYCLPGRTVVATSGALAALSGPELDAVLAHERAHLAGRHHALLTAVRAVARGPARIPVFGTAESQVGRLLELCADDAAAGRHEPRALASALLAMLGGPVPRDALGSADTAVLVRATRLLSAPPAPARGRADRLRLTATVAATLAVPVLTAIPMSVFCSLAIT